jgi:hypothetical protein
MDRRDVATITFKAIALWPIVTGLTQALEAVMTWDVAFAQLPAEVKAVTSSSDLLLTSVGSLKRLAQSRACLVRYSFSFNAPLSVVVVLEVRHRSLRAH